MPRFPTQLPDRSPEPWWQTTSLAELDESATVIDQFMRESTQPSPIPCETFARAVALQILCVDEGTMDAVIEQIDARSESYRPELRPDGDSQKQDAFASWLSRSQEIGLALLRCAELLPHALRDACGAALLGFLRRVEDHSNAHIEFIVHRRGVPFTPKSSKA